MKTAISLPDDLFQDIDDCARRLHTTRSGLIAMAARRFVAQYRQPQDATDAWNAAIARAGQPGDDPAAEAMMKRTKRILRGRK